MEDLLNRRTAVIAVTAGLAVVALAGVALWAWSALRPATADELIDGITVSAAVNDSALGATQAIADFGKDGLDGLAGKRLDQLVFGRFIIRQ